MVAAGVSAPAAAVGSVTATVSTRSGTPVDLGGPSVTVTVRSSGVVRVDGSIDATIDGPTQCCNHGASLHLFVDGTTDLFAGKNPPYGLVVFPAGDNAGVFVHTFIDEDFEVSPGVHTLSYRYSRVDNTSDGWTGSARFKNRKLVVQPVG